MEKTLSAIWSAKQSKRATSCQLRCVCVFSTLALISACSTGGKSNEGPRNGRASAAVVLPAGSNIIDAKPASLKPVTSTSSLQESGSTADGMSLALKQDPQSKVEGPADLKAGGAAENKSVAPAISTDDQKISVAVAGVEPSPLSSEQKIRQSIDAQTAVTASHGSVEKKSETTAHEHNLPEGTDPKVAMGWLKNGNTRFSKGFFRKDGASKKDVYRLAKGQSPHSVVLSCSDSRVPPEVVFDQKLGELFTIRTAGEALSASAIASIEYAVTHLGTRLVVVMGHGNCGAVKAAAATLGGGDAGSENLNQLVADIHPRIRSSLYGKKAPSKNFEDEGWANAKGVAKDLTLRSPILAQALASGRIKIVSALYHLDAGLVDFE